MGNLLGSLVRGSQYCVVWGELLHALASPESLLQEIVCTQRDLNIMRHGTTTKTKVLTILVNPLRIRPSKLLSFLSLQRHHKRQGKTSSTLLRSKDCLSALSNKQKGLHYSFRHAPNKPQHGWKEPCIRHWRSQNIKEDDP